MRQRRLPFRTSAIEVEAQGASILEMTPVSSPHSACSCSSPGARPIHSSCPSARLSPSAAASSASPRHAHSAMHSRRAPSRSPALAFARPASIPSSGTRCMPRSSSSSSACSSLPARVQRLVGGVGRGHRRTGAAHRAARARRDALTVAQCLRSTRSVTCAPLDDRSPSAGLTPPPDSRPHRGMDHPQAHEAR